MPILTTSKGPPASAAVLQGQPLPAAPQVIAFRKGKETQRTTWNLRDPFSCTSVPEATPLLSDDVTVTRRRVQSGRTLFHEGNHSRFLYAVRQGSFKSVLMLPDGRDLVTQFPMVGDVLGLASIGCGLYASSVIALEDSEVFAIPIDAIANGESPHATWNAALCRLMSQEIARDTRHILMLGGAGAEARVAMFLLEVSEAMQARGYSATDFHMRMTRAEIGSYVRLTLETVSRTLSAFQQRGWIGVEKRHITIPVLQALREVRDKDHA